MRKFLTKILMVIMLISFLPMDVPAYGQALNAGSRGELNTLMVDQFRQRNETFTIHYRGEQDLSKGDVLNALIQFDGTELNTLVQSAYGVAAVETQYTYITGQDVLFKFIVDYDYTQNESQRLQPELQQWVDTHLSPDMDDAVKVAIVTRYLSDHLLYELNDSVNNAYDGFYGGNTACSGYAELAALLLEKAGVPVKMIGGHIPAGLSDTEYLNRRLTAADFRAMDFSSVEEELQNLHVWNLVQIAGNWYQLDTTWVDGDSDGKPEEGGYNSAYFLGSDADFGRNHMWIRGEYPAAATRWWDNSAEPLKNFMKAYLKTRIYDYPEVRSSKELNDFAEDAYQSGRGSQAFRITEGVQSYDAFPVLGSIKNKVDGSSSSYRTAPKYPGDSYILTLDFKGRDADAKEMLPALKEAGSIQQGAYFSPAALLQSPELSGSDSAKWISLSPALLGTDNGQFKALKPGRGYIGVYTRDEAAIIPITVQALPLKVFLNGTALPLDPAPFITNGRTLVPLRGVFEAMGIAVSYTSQNKTITARRDDQTLQLTLGSRTALMNGRRIALDVPPQIQNDRAFVPARFIAESFGAAVAWEGENNRVSITE